MPNHQYMFTEAEILAACRLVMSDEDAISLARTCATTDGPSGHQGNLTLDTLVLLSLHSSEFDARVATWCVPLFDGPNGDRRRREFDTQRSVIKAAIASEVPWHRDDA
jgi:hypothetical protein